MAGMTALIAWRREGCPLVQGLISVSPPGRIS